MSGGGRNISLGDYTEEWRAHRRLVHGALLRCCQQSLHGVIERQALHLREVQKTSSSSGVPPHNLTKDVFTAQALIGYHMKPVDLSEDFTVAASNVITTLAFGKEVSVLFSSCLF